MNQLQLEKEQDYDGIFLPYIFIDEYMGDLYGEAVRVYLSLLRFSGEKDTSLSISGLADALRLTEHDILRAFRALENCGLISVTWKGESEVSALRILTCKTRSRASEFVRKELRKHAPQLLSPSDTTDLPETWTVPEKKTYTPEDRKKMSEDEELQALFYAASRYLGRNLSPSDADSILYYHDSLGFSWDLIEYLLDYCVSRGHRKFSYIDTVAIGWAKEHVTTVEEAKTSSLRYSEGYFKLMKAFGIKDRSLAKAELDLYAKWTDTYGFSSDIIIEACNRTILNVHKPSFDYADSILNGWKQQGIHTLEDVRRSDAVFQARKSAKDTAPGTPSSGKRNTKDKNQGMQRNYSPSDIDDLEARLLSGNASSSASRAVPRRK